MQEYQNGRLATKAREAKTEANRELFRFSNFCLDGESLTLSQLGERIALPPKAIQLLLMLLDRAPRLVTRDEMRAKLWRDSTFIEFEGSLNTCIRQVRSALGDSASRSDFIQTMPKLGYRFVAELHSDSPLPSPTRLWVSSTIVVLATVALLAAFFWPLNSDPVPAELLIVLPAEVSTAQPVDRLAGYGVAMIVSGRIGDLQPHRLAVINSRSLRGLVVNNWDLERLKSPDYIVRTRIRGQKSEYVLDTRLQRSDTGEILSTHTETLNADISTVLRVSPEIIVSWLSESLGLVDENAANNPPSDDGHLWDNELVAAFWHLEANTLESANLALEMFDRVLVEDRKNIWAHEGKLAALADLSFWQSGSPAAVDTFAEMETTARFMLDNDVNSGSSYQAIGFVSLFRDWDVMAAMNHAEAALLISPDDPRNHSLYAAAQAASGDTTAAVKSAWMAERLDPATMAVRSDRCWYLLFDKKYVDAAELCESVASLDTRDFSARLGLVQAKAILGDKKAALQLMIDSIRMIDEDAFEHFTALPLTWEELGCRRATEILSDEARFGVLHFQLARYHAQCGKPTATLRELRLSLEQREFPALYLRVSPEFESLHDDPEFRKLLRLLP